MKAGALLRSVLSLIPEPARRPLLSWYHFILAALGALAYGHPSRSLLTIAVTGTKGKSTVTEMVHAILEEAGHKTALINSIRFKKGGAPIRNTIGRSMPGRFFIQRFLHEAAQEGCTAAVLEMTSEGARQHRHRFLELDALIFLNLSPEHIESHGSLEEYANAKLEIGRQLMRSGKRPRLMVANADDKESTRYLTLGAEHSLPFSLSANAPFEAGERGGYFTFDGVRIEVPLPGEFSLKNALAAATLARALGISAEVIAKALKRLAEIPGRTQFVEAGQDFLVVVDYAHTPDSLKALCESFPGRRKICVLGSAGGGRDTWKRPVMGNLAEKLCEQTILTSDDSYDEDPRAIIDDIAHGMEKRPEIAVDRREAIRAALRAARRGDAVLITGKGVDPMYGPKGTKREWNDAVVARQELEVLLGKTAV